MEALNVKGVRYRLDGLDPEAAHYLRTKLKRVHKRERFDAGIWRRLQRLLLSADWLRCPLEPMVSGRTLVVGCAGGVETLQIGAVGIDIDRDALRIAARLRAHAEGASAEFLGASGGELPFRDGAFDSLLSDNVVEHIPDPVLARHFREALRVLKPGGRYVFTTPNRLFENPAKDGHCSLHSYAEWEQIAREAGFREILTPRRRSGPLGALDWKKVEEVRAAGASRRLWLSHQGLRMVVAVATR